MTLQTLKDKLQDVSDTDIGQVFLDQSKYLANTAHVEKTYPVIVWCFNNAKFQKDHRSTTIQKIKTVIVTVFVMVYFDQFTDSEDVKLTAWDLAEGYFEAYINKIDSDHCIQVVNIQQLKGQYMPEGSIDQNKEIGIMYEGVELKLFCNDSD
jgi:hypothetical protein